MPTKIGRTFTGARKQFFPDAFPVASNDSSGYQPELNPDSLGASPLFSYYIIYRCKMMNRMLDTSQNQRYLLIVLLVRSMVVYDSHMVM